MNTNLLVKFSVLYSFIFGNAKKKKKDQLYKTITQTMYALQTHTYVITKRKVIVRKN